MNVYELNLDGLVGPTHHYAGLSVGNIASTDNAFSPANPKAAALQGLEKMRLLHHMGLKQGLLPPHPRPNLELLRQLGFMGKPSALIKQAMDLEPSILSAAFSSSSMWTANTATVSSSLDSKDGFVHFTAANLVNNLHRYQETSFSSYLLQRIFSDTTSFKHHAALPQTVVLGDEGAANHNRFCLNHAQKGINLFVYGKQVLPANNTAPHPLHFPARQTREASCAISRLHQLDDAFTLFAQQNPLAIDQGVFHNDVISVANENVFLLHEQAFVHQKEILENLKQLMPHSFSVIEAKNTQFSVADAVKSYLFNSQLITLPTETKSMILIAPAESQENPRVSQFIDEMIADTSNPITTVQFLNLKQSMRNGGGPACLRLRVPLTEEELAKIHQGILITEDLLQQLEKWIHKHYRDQLHANDLADPQLLDEIYSALDELSTIIKLPNLYPFQRN